ncbi:hypothetical protein GGTG_08126 [Gaeumannomyces tritici R3-111a-1]|uniref:Uncharacterized protein n=1 Tax=Gaeumannomyces tritici (strain R3-111a-1) TaxID=644352 RepID=J3P3N9_GAET3|nr:hypothetical protein GGTG_08126 [Gaeumannomyces tritici R3-111a-1]EJT74283.1 hypothetical protein GGTG_08126 [Gaeumannomyces tritici R3-111a-1]
MAAPVGFLAERGRAIRVTHDQGVGERWPTERSVCLCARQRRAGEVEPKYWRWQGLSGADSAEVPQRCWGLGSGTAAAVGRLAVIRPNVIGRRFSLSPRAQSL